MEKRGEVYYDAKTGTYYIVPNAAGELTHGEVDGRAGPTGGASCWAGCACRFCWVPCWWGATVLSAGKLLHMLWTKVTGGAADWSVSDEKVVFAIRLPRMAAAPLVGAALAVPGTAYQGMFRNPMVSPDILGPPPAQASARQWLSCWGRVFRHFRRRLLLRPAGRGGGVAGEPPVQNKPHGGADFSGMMISPPCFRRGRPL